MSEHKKHGEKHHAQASADAKPASNDKSQLMVVGALIVGLIIGAIIAYGIGYGVGMTSPNNASALNVAELQPKVASYLNSNFLSPDAQSQGLTFVVEDNNKIVGGLAEFSVYADQDGQRQLAGLVYANNEKLVIAQGEAFDLNASLPTADDTPADTTIDTQKSDTPLVDLFIMSFCPYGLQAVKAFKPAIQLLEQDVDFQLGYVIYSNYVTSLKENYGIDANWSEYCTDEDQTYCSMHGINEVKEDVRQMCIQKYQNDKLWTYMDALIADYDGQKVSASNIETKWKDYAALAGVDVAQVEECYANEATTLLEEQVQVTNLLGVSGSPTALVNGVQYSGARSADAFKGFICDSFNTAPQTCTAALSDTGATATGSC